MGHELTDHAIEELNYHRKGARATKRAREEGYITAEEAREQSPYGWFICDNCGWDGPFAPLRDFIGFEVYCPDCEHNL